MIDFAGNQGDGIKSHSNPLPNKGMGGKGKIDSPVANFGTGAAKTDMPKGNVTGKTAIDSPVASNK